MKQRVAIWFWVLCGGLWLLDGCGGDDDLAAILQGRKQPAVSDLEHPNPLVRIKAIRWSGDHQAVSAVPLLVDRLMEDDPAIRFYAIDALQKITGTDQGFDYKADGEQRRQAVLRWRDYLEGGKGREKGQGQT